MCQIIFDKNCKIAKKMHYSNQTNTREQSMPQPVDQTELTFFERPSNSSTAKTPSFNLNSKNKKVHQIDQLHPQGRLLHPRHQKGLFHPH
jgi:hypothetical protein